MNGAARYGSFPEQLRAPAAGCRKRYPRYLVCKSTVTMLPLTDALSS